MELKYIKLYENFTDDELDKFIKSVLKKCKPYIEMLKTCEKGKMLIRGTKDSIDDKKIYKHRERKPKDMDQYWHDKLNGYLEDQVGWEARNGIFCYIKNVLGYKFFRNHYGTQYLLFPIGDFEYCWNPNVKDLYVDFEESWNGFDYDTDYYEYDYDFEYGEFGNNDETYQDIVNQENQKGQYVYNGIETNIKIIKDAIKYILDNKEIFNINDEDEDVGGNIEWLPDMSLEDYTDMKNELEEDLFNDKIDETIGSYITDNINDAEEFNEISIKCEKYYMIDIKYAKQFTERIWV